MSNNLIRSILICVWLCAIKIVQLGDYFMAE